MKGMGNDLIREARKRRGLTQHELADKLGTTQSAIARLESAATAPTFDRVIEILRALDLDLDFMLVERDDSDWIQARRMLALKPDERMSELAAMVSAVEELRGSYDPQIQARTDLGDPRAA